ncbi:MAG: PA2778 family cysteine peptidase [Pseudomonas sagittaria]|nr:PA2778 family cysteine peptidase [Pseudomonas sagittaria]
MHQLMRRQVFCLLLAGLLLGGCATPPQLSPKAELLPERVELSEVPFFPQAEYQCGPAALATMLNQRGVSTTPGLLKDRVFLPGRNGSLQVELVAAARDHDLLVYPLAANLEFLLAEVAAGNPVLVLQNLAFDWYPRWHFAVLVGYDRRKQQLILRSGTTRRWVTNFASFDATWARGGRWAVLTLPPSRLPAQAELRPWLTAASDLEQTGHVAAAGRAYEAAVRHWPREGVAWFALGNARYASRDFDGAQAALRQAVTVEPTLAPGWANLAHVLAEQGCAIPAGQAQQCARVLVPEESRFREALPTATRVGACTVLPACPQ